MRRSGYLLLSVLAAWPSAQGQGGERVLEPRLRHLRVGGAREWADFPMEAEASRLPLRFSAEANAAESTLRLRQQDVRQNWKILLNDKELARLVADENDTVLYLPVPAGALRSGENILVIEQIGKIPDDVRVGEIVLIDRPRSEVVSEATLEVSVVDAAKEASNLPCRITVLNAQGALTTVGAASRGELAVRPGVVYTGTGRARFGLAAGEYTIVAGRGFEYGIDSVRISVKRGDRLRKTLRIRREVPTPNYVSCDTHTHTLTYSGHGDATLDERVITIAGEGVELPIATDHNRQIDYHAAAVKQGVRKYFTPVVGNEVTTPVGHFNIFPVAAGDQIPDFKAKDWKSIFASIQERTAAKVIVLNHPRDRHSGFCPFGAEHHNALLGQNLDGWGLRANAMEVINSGAQQTDALRLYRDWFGLLNRGLVLTPVGASDSHDVSRYIVGQARTYIRCRDGDPGNIDVAKAVSNFVKGRVLVSCGLLADIRVNGQYGPGELARAPGDVKVTVRVLGPSWVTADKVELYANGVRIREAKIATQKTPIKWEGEWTLPRFRHDVHLVAIASGPGVGELYWPIARPYQPTSPRVDRRVIGSTGAVRLDGDGDGRWSSAFDYAQRLHKLHAGDVPRLIEALAEYDEAVAAQAAGLLQAAGTSVQDPEILKASRTAGEQVARGFEAFALAWRECQIARSSGNPP